MASIISIHRRGRSDDPHPFAFGAEGLRRIDRKPDISLQFEMSSVGLHNDGLCLTAH
jgi:hypothetical protein